MNIYDEGGKEHDWAWLREQFGDVEIEGDGELRIVELRARTGPTAIVVTVLDSGGEPIPGIPVHWYWPGGLHVEHTNQNGDVGLAMGGGAYYRPPAGGPHWLWVEDRGLSQTIGGLGMIGRTEHRHLNVVYQFGTVEPDGDDINEAFTTLLNGMDRTISESRAKL